MLFRPTRVFHPKMIQQGWRPRSRCLAASTNPAPAFRLLPIRPTYLTVPGEPSCGRKSSCRSRGVDLVIILQPKEGIGQTLRGPPGHAGSAGTTSAGCHSWASVRPVSSPRFPALFPRTASWSTSDLLMERIARNLSGKAPA